VLPKRHDARLAPVEALGRAVGINAVRGSEDDILKGLAQVFVTGINQINPSFFS
jgi:hypothetical protein